MSSDTLDATAVAFGRGAFSPRIGAVSDRIQQAITTLGGKVDKVVPHAKRRLAYEVAHHRDGQYGVVEFSLPPTQARELERTIRLTEDILRHLVVRRDE
ncbi:MAG: 30S ribosomal protein S6 [Chloroflexi bacterium]|nr:MAG: 30S ribosomal protein S6 [Chloroflexota bacterium]